MPGSLVNVVVRVRPTLPSDDDSATCVTVGANNSIATSNSSSYTFDKVFGCETTQAEVFRHCAADLVDRSLAGENVTILAYGQTGSGKSYSMGTNASGTKDSLNAGIIPRFLNSLFNGLRRSTTEAGEAAGSTFSTRVAFLEIYNEKLIDLLPENSATTMQQQQQQQQQQKKKLEIVRQRNGAMSVRGLTEVPVEGCAQALQKLSEGDSRRQTAATLMNSESSRSHAIFQVMVTRRRPLIVEGEEDQPLRYVETTSKVSLVDLAGSERLKRTGAEGLRQKEGININYGLSVLGNVIKSLCDLSNEKKTSATTSGDSGGKSPSGEKSSTTSSSSHIPYRESQLTRLLQDSLGGNSRTLFLACLSPCLSSEDETLNTLRYANRAKNIQNQVKVNVSDQSDRRFLNMRAKVSALHRALVWEKFGHESSYSGDGGDGNDDDDNCGGGGGDGLMGGESKSTQERMLQEKDKQQLVEKLMAREDVVAFVKSVTTGMNLSASTSLFSSSSSSSSSSFSSSFSSSQFTSERNLLPLSHGATAAATALQRQHDVEESHDNDDEALEVVDKIMEMELAEEQYSTEV